MTSTALAPDPLSVEPAFAEAVQRDFFRNASAFVLFDATWAIGMAFAMISVLIPSYLRELASPRVLIGLTTSLAVLMMPLQLFSERLLGGRNRRRNAWLAYSACSATFVLYGAIALLLPETWRWTRIVGFMLTIACFWVCNLLAQPVYYSILTDNCPIYRRGRLFGYRTVALGTAGLGSLYLAQSLEPYFQGVGGYQRAMIIAGVIYVVSCLCPLLIRDHLDPARAAVHDRPTPRDLFAHAWGNVRDLWNTPNYRIFIFFLAIIAAATSLGPYLITFARDVLGVTVNLSQRFQLASFAGMVLAGLVLGNVADRFGYRVTLLLAAVFGLSAYIVAQSTAHPQAAMLAYALNVLAGNAVPMVMVNFSVELMPAKSPADLTAAANLFAVPATTLAPWLCGSVLDLAGVAGVPAAGYHVVFAVAVVLALIGGLGTALLVQEPRSGRVYVIKIVERN